MNAPDIKPYSNLVIKICRRNTTPQSFDYFRYCNAFGFVCALFIFSTASASQLSKSTVPVVSSAPSADKIIVEPCMRFHIESADEVRERGIKIQAWLCGKGMEEAHRRFTLQPVSPSKTT